MRFEVCWILPQNKGEERDIRRVVDFVCLVLGSYDVLISSLTRTKSLYAFFGVFLMVRRREDPNAVLWTLTGAWYRANERREHISVSSSAHELLSA